MNELVQFLAGNSIWVYMFIFFGKILEVAISTLRFVLIGKGERIVGAVLAIFEISIWLFVTGTVITGFQSDLIKVVAYIAACSIGIYLGSWLEEKLAIGLSAIQVVVYDQNSADILMNALRDHNFAVTTMEVQGKDGTHYMLMLTIKRKSTEAALSIIEKTVSNTFITISEVKKQKGGFTNHMLPRF